MNDRIDQLIREALDLPSEQRSAMVLALLDSLDAEADHCVTESWRAELSRRRAELAAGVVSPVQWAEAKGRLQAL